MHVHITLSEAQGAIFTKFTMPATTGDIRLCFENARQEYWAQKGLGRSPEYWDGTVEGYRPEDNPNGPPVTLRHAWVVLDGLISDPTPFAQGNITRPAHEHWTPATRYAGERRIDENALREPLSNFVEIRDGEST